MKPVRDAKHLDAVIRFTEGDKRRHTRVQLRENGNIIMSEDGPPQPCHTVDMSAGGVRLALDDDRADLPDQFWLRLERQERDLPCALVWRREGQIGARWIAEQSGS